MTLDKETTTTPWANRLDQSIFHKKERESSMPKQGLSNTKLVFDINRNSGSDDSWVARRKKWSTFPWKLYQRLCKIKASFQRKRLPSFFFISVIFDFRRRILLDLFYFFQPQNKRNRSHIYLYRYGLKEAKTHCLERQTARKANLWDLGEFWH